MAGIAGRSGFVVAHGRGGFGGGRVWAAVSLNKLKPLTSTTGCTKAKGRYPFRDVALCLSDFSKIWFGDQTTTLSSREFSGCCEREPAHLGSSGITSVVRAFSSYPSHSVSRVLREFRCRFSLGLVYSLLLEDCSSVEENSTRYFSECNYLKTHYLCGNCGMYCGNTVRRLPWFLLSAVVN